LASVGALLVVRRPGNIIGWIMVAIGNGYAIGVFWAAVTFSLAAHPSAIPWLDLRVTAWRGAPAPLDDPARVASPEATRAFVNTETEAQL